MVNMHRVVPIMSMVDPLYQLRTGDDFLQPAHKHVRQFLLPHISPFLEKLEEFVTILRNSADIGNVATEGVAVKQGH